jgi:hypothetical protein
MKRSTIQIIAFVSLAVLVGTIIYFSVKPAEQFEDDPNAKYSFSGADWIPYSKTSKQNLEIF